MDTPSLADLKKLLRLASFGAEMAHNHANTSDPNVALKHKSNDDLVLSIKDWLDRMEAATMEDAFVEAADTLHHMSVLNKVQAATVLTVDVGHLTEKTVEHLNSGMNYGMTMYDRGDDGWFVSVSPSVLCDVPSDMEAVLSYANDNGFAWVIISVGGPVYSGLTHYGWSVQ